MAKPTVRLAIIGCGAVTELCHLPAARLAREAEIVALVDKDIARARFLGQRYGIVHCTEDSSQLPKNVDGVIIALPNYLHAPVAIELLNRGVHLLVEKPMALTVEEAEAMVKTADVNGVALQVGFMFRFCKGACLVKQSIDEGWLGALQSFSIESGLPYDWPVVSEFIFRKEQAGGGVLVDIGSHMLDLLHWWLGKAVEVEYRDDSLGGVEADCQLSLVVQGPTGLIQGTVTLSRLRKLGERARIVGDRFTIECDLSTPATVRIWPSTWEDKGVSFVSDFGSLPSQSWEEVYADQLRAFARAIATGSNPVVSGEVVLDSVALIERCYRTRQPLGLPWMRAGASAQQGSSEA